MNFDKVKTYTFSFFNARDRALQQMKDRRFSAPLTNHPNAGKIIWPAKEFGVFVENSS